MTQKSAILTIEQISEALKRMNLQQVYAATGISKSSLSRLRLKGDDAQYQHRTIVLISAYLIGECHAMNEIIKPIKF